MSLPMPRSIHLPTLLTNEPALKLWDRLSLWAWGGGDGDAQYCPIPGHLGTGQPVINTACRAPRLSMLTVANA
jgi:hypothetical protein